MILAGALQLLQTPPSVQYRIVLVTPSTGVSSATYMLELGCHVDSGVSTPQSPIDAVSFWSKLCFGAGANTRCLTMTTPEAC